MTARPPKSALLCWWLLGGGLEFTLLTAAAIITAVFAVIYTLFAMGYGRWLELFLALTSGAGCIGMAVTARSNRVKR